MVESGDDEARAQRTSAESAVASLLTDLKWEEERELLRFIVPERSPQKGAVWWK